MSENTSVNQDALERSAMIVATLTSFIGPFTISSINVALPAIQKELQINAIELSWIATSYLLAVAVGLVPAGKYADIHGRKKVFATGVAIFTLGSFVAVFASSVVTLILTRILQGLGAALFITTGMAILISIFPPQKRGKAIGLFVSAVYIGLSVGPFAGGLITQHFGWRVIFLAMVPMGLASLIVTLRFLKGEWRGEPGQQLDINSCLIYCIAILLLVYGATQIATSLGIALFITGLALLVLFLRLQTKVRFPVFEVKLFTGNKVFLFSSLAALLNYSATFAITFLLSLYLQYLKGMSPQSAGTILMAQPIVMALLSPYAGKLSDKIEPRLLASAGMSITVIGMVLFSTLQPETSIYLIVANLLLLGTGFALFSSPNMSAIMGAVEKRYYGQASGVVATMRLMGQMFSMAMATLVLTLIVGRRPITFEIYDLFLSSMHTVYIISAFLCLLGVYFSWSRGSILSPPPPPGSEPK